MQTSLPGFAHPLDELRDELDRLWGNLVAAPPRARTVAGPAPVLGAHSAAVRSEFD